nr:hypothetical protein [Tanacetum cinerariifolium]
MDAKLAAFEKNNTWTLTVLPPGHKPSSIAKLVIVRVLIAIATAKQWPLYQLDINNAFLHGYIDEQIYMTPPEDNVLITCSSASKIQHLKQALDAKFTIKYPGLAKYFLGIKICNTVNGTHLNQRKYILDLLTDAGLTAAKPNPSPLPTNLKLSVDKGVHLFDPAAYRRLVERCTGEGLGKEGQ